MQRAQHSNNIITTNLRVRQQANVFQREYAPKESVFVFFAHIQNVRNGATSKYLEPSVRASGIGEILINE